MEYPQPARTHLIIGLTGNIGSGKSSVRKMLEHMGALGIDADRIAQDALKADSPAYSQVRDLFGDDIINDQGEIDRKKLGAIVFQDPVKLKQLEEISHPLVSSAINKIIAHSPLPIVVIEAIKLLESDLASLCQSVWVVESQAEVVYQRLEQSRGMSHADVNKRLAQQSPVSEKKQKADAVIDNSAGSQDTWRQVHMALLTLERNNNISEIAEFQSFSRDILPPAETSIEKLRGILRDNPHSLLNQILAANMTDQANRVQLEEWLKDDELVFRSLFYFYFLQTGKNTLACWQQDHFSCIMNGRIRSTDNQDSEDLLTLIERMEHFAEERLCTRLIIPINKEEASFIEKMGYERQQEPVLYDEVYTKAGYNLYTKTNPLSFRIF